jgi:hypothetical protein
VAAPGRLVRLYTARMLFTGRMTMEEILFHPETLLAVPGLRTAGIHGLSWDFPMGPHECSPRSSSAQVRNPFLVLPILYLLRSMPMLPYAAVTTLQSTSTVTLRRSSSTERIRSPFVGLLCTKIPSIPLNGPRVMRTRCPSRRYG